jgi:ubiquinone/menaquinone biosynthesis C-methylase UbiE
MQMTTTREKTINAMRREWDTRARKDAFHYIASWRKDWDVSAFLKSGEEDYERLVAPVLERLGFSPDGKTMLELGCGAGRMTRSFAGRFGRVLAFDVSSEMLQRARSTLLESGNVEWIQGNGADLAGAAGESVDFVFSYLVLQHLPEQDLACNYIREVLRVLKPGGVCLFQFNGMKRPTMNWKGRFAWGILDAFWTVRLCAFSRFLARLIGFDPEMIGRNWHGIALTTRRVDETVSDSGGVIIEFQDSDTPMAWCCAKKVPTRGASR